MRSAWEKTEQKFAALREVGRALVNATEETPFLSEVCRILVQVFRYRFVWIGLAENGTKRVVRPVAHAGIEDGYLETANITWADTLRGRGTTGAAIRTGRPAVSHDIASDPHYAPWRDEAIRRGFASSLALPLIADGQTLGALSLYAAEPSAFDSEEMSLLNDIAETAAFGLWSLRCRVDHARMQEKLSESETKYGVLFQAASDAVFLIERDRFIDCNARTLELFGCDREQIVGYTPFDFSPPRQPDGRKSREKAVELIDAALGGVPQLFEWQHRRLDGKRFDVEVGLNRIETSDGRFVLALLRDITKQKQAERALRDSEERYRELFQNMSSGVAVYEVRGDGDQFVLKDLNVAGRWITNLPHNDVIGRDVTDVFPDVERFGLLEIFEEVWTTGQPKHHSVALYDDDRLRAWYENYVYKLPAGDIVAVFDDVTSEKQAEENLRRVQRLLSQTQAVTKVGGWEYDARTQRVTWTDEVYAIYGVDASVYDPNDVEQDIAFYDPEDQPKIIQAFQRAAQAGKPYDLELRLIDARGQRRWVRTMGQAESQDGQVVRVFGNIVDITERKKSTEEFREMESQLAHVSRLSTMGEMAAGIAHEVSQPLYAISNYAKAIRNLLADESPSVPELLSEWNNEIIDIATRAHEIIKRLRSFAKKDSRTQSGACVNEIIAESLELVAFETRRHQVAVDQQLSSVPLVVDVDRVEIQQVLVNLLSNAYEALQSTPVKQRQVTIRTIASGTFAETSVVDTGPGVPDDIVNRLFDPFVTTKPNGLGIGLAISMTIVEAHGGRLWATQTPGGGATFHFTLPLATGG